MEKATKTDLPACPVETTLTLIGDKWKVLILRDLLPGTKRFGELKKSIGSVSQKVLTAQLRAMEESGLVHRQVYAEVPPRVGVFPDRVGPEPEAHSGLHVALGRGLSEAAGRASVVTPPLPRHSRRTGGAFGTPKAPPVCFVRKGPAAHLSSSAFFA